MTRQKKGKWDPTAAVVQQQGSGIISGTGAIPNKRLRLPDSDLVYETTRWERYLWGDFASDASEAQQVASDGKEQLPRWPAFMRELYSRFYAEAPERVEEVAPENRWAERSHEQAGAIPEFDRLRDRCMGDKLWSGLAATSIASEVLQALPEPDEPLQDPRSLDQRVRGLQGLQSAGVPVGDELAQAEQQLAQAQQQAQQYADSIDDGAVRQALRRGCESAQKSIDEVQNAANAFGWGMNEGSDGRGGDSEAKRKLFQKVQNSEKLKALAELAGRMRRLAAQKQRSKADHARDEISDITVGDDLARLLPSEVAKLTRPDTRLLFFKGLIERSLLCYELKGSEPQSKGPIIVCVDNSGSMAGESELWSKAVALALLDIARRQKRAYAVIHFDTRVRCSLIWEKGPNPPEWDKIVEVMEFFSGGGTNFEPPLKKALDLLESDQFKKADVILVTDGAAGTDFADEYRRRAALKEATTYGVEIGGYGDRSAMDSFCDHTMSVDDLTGGNDATDTLFAL